jgi:hypothetical protein
MIPDREDKNVPASGASPVCTNYHGLVVRQRYYYYFQLNPCCHFKTAGPQLVIDVKLHY